MSAHMVLQRLVHNVLWLLLRVTNNDKNIRVRIVFVVSAGSWTMLYQNIIKNVLFVVILNKKNIWSTEISAEKILFL